MPSSRLWLWTTFQCQHWLSLSKLIIVCRTSSRDQSSLPMQRLCLFLCSWNILLIYLRDVHALWILSSWHSFWIWLNLLRIYPLGECSVTVWISVKKLIPFNQSTRFVPAGWDYKDRLILLDAGRGGASCQHYSWLALNPGTTWHQSVQPTSLKPRPG